MATYVNDLRLKEIATGDESGTWGTSTNTNLELIAEAFSFGTEAITTNADTHATTIADGSTDPGRSIYLKYTGTLDSACTITIGPNTVSKLWFIENGTSGSQNIIISQGSGANVTIPAGHVKAVYSDGAGSGAAIVDAFTDLNLAGTTTVDVLSGSGNATIGGTLGVTGIVTLTDDLIIGDGKTIGSASDVDAMTIASNGQVTFSQTLIGTALDISGDIDVDGTTNLDVVDIDGAVDMASTLAVGGVVTANAGVVVDNITIDGTEIDLSSGDLTIDVAGDIILDADGSDVFFKDGGTTTYRFKLDSTPSMEVTGGTLDIQTMTDDADILFKGSDGGSGVTALTLDMSDAGAATFNAGATFGNNVDITGTVTATELNVAEFLTSTNVFESNVSGQKGARLRAAVSDASTPTFSFNDDTNTGMYSSGADTLNFSTVGTERMRIDSSGNVGIGTTSPSFSAGTGLEISRAGAATLRVTDSDGTTGSTELVQVDTDAFLFTRQSGALVLGTNDTERMRIDSSGALQIGGTSNAGFVDFDSVSLQLNTQRNPNTGAFVNTAKSHASIALRGADGGSDIRFGTASANNTTSSERMRIDSSGRVGIGTTSPTTALDVVNASAGATVATFAGQFSSSGDVKLASFERYGGAVAAAIEYNDATTDMEFGTTTSHAFSLKTADTRRVTIDSSGRLLVASSTAVTGNTTAKLQINGTDNAGSTISIGRFSNNTNAPVLNFIKSRNGTVGGNTIVQDDDNLGSILFGGNDGTDNVSIAAKIFGEVDGTPGSNDMPGRLTFFTTADGASTPTERMRIDASGNVGIGESSTITGKIHVKGSPPATNGGIVFVRNSDAASDNTTFGGIHFSSSPGTDFSIGKANVNSATSLSFRNGNTGASLMELSSSGNLGIGTTSPTGKVNIVSGSSGSYLLNLDYNDNTDGGGFFQSGSTGLSLLLKNSSATQTVQIATAGDSFFNGGNVGIGTTSPSEPLHVNEGTGGVSTTLLLQNSSASVDGRGTNLTFKSSSTEIGQIQSKTSSDATSGILAFKTASSGTLSEQMRIDKNGNVGIGTTSPAVNLDIVGDARIKASSTTATALTIKRSSSSGRAQMAFTDENDNQIFRIGMTGAGSENFSFFDGSETILDLNRSSNTATFVGSVTATAFNTSSDARLKDVTGLSRGLDVINNLNPVSYNWKADGKADEGLIAQEVEELVPNAVNKNQDGYYQMDYSKLVTHLVKGMQEQQEQIESLKSEIANLKEK